MKNKKTVVITGASGGIGSAIAKKFAQEGYNLVLTCNKSTDSLEKLCSELQSLQNPHTDGNPNFEYITYQGDLSVSNNVSELFSLVKEQFGYADVLINNAGISYVGLITDMSDDDWHNVIETNLSSVFYCCREAVPAMVSNKNGRIINISSVWGEHGASCEVAYSASKGGVNALTKALAKELAPSGITVNAVACGLIDTKMNSHLSDEEMSDLYDEIPAGRAGKPSEVAALVYELAGDNSYLTGQIITIDGGWI